MDHCITNVLMYQCITYCGVHMAHSSEDGPADGWEEESDGISGSLYEFELFLLSD